MQLQIYHLADEIRFRWLFQMDTMTATDSDERQHVQNMAHVAVSFVPSRNKQP